MGKAVRLYVSVLALTGIVLLGQTPPKDVEGWDKIKWGMTAARGAISLQIESAVQRKRILDNAMAHDD